MTRNLYSRIGSSLLRFWLALWLALANFSPANPIPAPAVQAAGSENNALKFSGLAGSYASATKTYFANPANDFSLEAWIKPDPSMSGDGGLISKSTASKGYWIEYIQGLQTIYAGIGYDSISPVPGLAPLGKWSHVALTLSGSTLTLYINGVAVGSTGSSPTYSTTSDFTVGRMADGSALFKGTIDEVRVWHAARTADQIEQNRFSPLTGSEADLYAYYKMDGSGGTNVGVIGPSMDMTISVSADWVRSGAFSGPGNSLSLDGKDDYGAVASSAGLNLTGDYTLEAWINPTAFPAGGGIISKFQQAGDNGMRLSLSGSGNHRGLRFNDLETADNLLAANRWQHIAALKSGSAYHLYLDGVEQALSGSTYSEQANSSELSVGADQLNETSPGYFCGMIDEVRVWNVARSPAELRASMNLNLNGDESGLAAYYRMDSGQAGGSNTGYIRLDDQSPNHLDGTLHNLALSGGSSNWVASAAYTVFIGEGSDWQTAGNWSRGQVPASQDHVGIGGYGMDPILNFDGAAGSLVIEAGRTLTVSGSPTLSLSGNWFNSGYFSPGTGTLALTGTSQVLAGSSTFYNLSKTVSTAATLTFPASQTQTILGSLTLQGAPGQALSLRSDTPGSQWVIDPQGTRTITNTDVQDSKNINTLAIDVGGMQVSNSGNNGGWLFVPSSTTTSLSTALNPAQVGAPIALRVSVSGSAGTPAAGSVSFSRDGSIFASQPLETDGSASASLFGLAQGSYAILAHYSGAPGFPASDSEALHLEVGPSLFPVHEPFRGSSAGSGWQLLGSAALTSGSADPSGQGWLRLTNQANQRGAAVLNTAFPSADGIQVSFDYAFPGDGSTASGGLTLFLLDGATSTPTAGADGGGLGYAANREAAAYPQGVTGGYTAVGLDGSGEFSSPAVGACSNPCPGLTPNAAVIRGAGSLANGFEYLTGIGLSGPGQSVYATRTTPNRVQIRIFEHKLSLEIDFQDGNGFIPILTNIDLVSAPETLKLGLSAGTGGLPGTIEVRDLSVELPVNLGVSLVNNHPGAAAGTAASYTATISNDTANPAAGLQASGLFPTGISSISWTCGATAGSGCGTSAGSGSSILTSLDLLPGGSATIEISGQIDLASAGTSLHSTLNLGLPTHLTNTGASSASNDAPVSKLASATGLQVTPSSGPAGSSVDLLAMVSGTGGLAPDGMVDFYDGASLLGSSALDTGTGQASLSISTLAAGSHSLSAHYPGNSHYNPSTSSPSQGYQTQPAVLSVEVPAARTYILGETLTFKVNWSEAVTVSGGTPRIAFSAGTNPRYASLLSGSGTGVHTYSYTVQLDDSAPGGISLAAALDANGASLDGAALPALPALHNMGLTSGINLDGIQPGVSSISPPANGTFIVGQALTFDLAWSEAVTVSGTPQLAILFIGHQPVQADYFSGSGSSTLRFRYIIQNGDSAPLGIALESSSLALNGGSIHDLNGNPAILALQNPPSLPNVRVDGILPVISSVSLPADATYPIGQALDVTLYFNKPVFALGPLTLSLQLGAQTAAAGYSSGNGGSSLTFRYVIQEGDSAPSGIHLIALALNSGTLNDAAGNAADLTLPAIGSGAGVKVDGIRPVITGVQGPSGGSYAQGGLLTFDVSFSKAVSAGGSPRLGLTIGGIPLWAAYHSKLSPSVVRFQYTVEAGINGAFSSLSNAIDFNNGSITDAPGNSAAPNIPDGAYNGGGLLVDTTPPYVTSVDVPIPGYYRAGQILNFTVHWNEPVQVSGTPALDLHLGAAPASAAFQSGQGTTELLFSYTVQAGDSASAGGVTLDALNLAGGTILDSVNPADLSLHNIGSLASLVVDTSAPKISAITRLDPSSNNAASVRFQVAFDEPVSGVSLGNFSLSGSGLSGATLEGLSGSGRSYILSAGGYSGQGTLGLDKASNTGILDLAGNPLANGSQDSGPLYAIDRQPPQITSITVPADGTYTEGETLSFSVHWSEAVTVSGTPILGLVSGGKTYNAYCTAGSSASTTDCVYSVQLSDQATGGLTLAGISLPLGATITDGLNPADLTLHNAGDAAHVYLKGIFSLVVTTSGSGSGQVNRSPALPGYTKGTSIQVSAVADANSLFSGWSGALTGNKNPESLTIDSDLAIDAQFTARATQILIDASYGPGTSGWGISHFAALQPAIQAAAPQAILHVAAGTYTGNVNLNRNLTLLFEAGVIIDGTFTQSDGSAGMAGATGGAVARTESTGADLTFNGSLSLYGGSFHAPAGVLEFRADFILSGGTFSPNGGTVRFGGSAPQTIYGSPVFASLESASSGGLSCAEPLTVTTSATVSAGTFSPASGTSISQLVVQTGAALVLPASGGATIGSLVVQAGGSSNAHSLTLSQTGSGSGQIEVSPPGNTFAHGTILSLTAKAADSSTFSGWDGAVHGAANPIQLTVDGARSVSAIFTLKTFTITSQAGPGGKISPNSATVLVYGASQQFKISPDPGYQILSVSVDGVPKGAISQFTFSNVSADHTIQATFSAGLIHVYLPAMRR